MLKVSIIITIIFQNGQTHFENFAAFATRLFKVCLTILGHNAGLNNSFLLLTFHHCSSPVDKYLFNSFTQSAFTCSKLTTETLEQTVKTLNISHTLF